MKQLAAFLLCLFYYHHGVAQSKDSTFREDSMVLQTASGKIYGTLTVPSGSKKMPVALIIAGSGPTDRNGNNTMMTNDCLKMLAHELAKRKIASIRYDKRGIAASAAAMSAEKDLRFDTYAQDASEWIALLRKDKRFSTITTIGHSEGSLIAMVTSNRPDRFVSIAGAGFPAGDIIKKQLESQPPQIRDASYAIVDSLTAGKLVDSVPKYLNAIFRPSVQPYLVSWFKIDPASALKSLNRPTLIVQGTTDLQLSVQDAERLKAALPSAKLVVIDSMNHVLKITISERKQNLKTYFDPGFPISDKLIDAVSRFIQRNHQNFKQQL